MKQDDATFVANTAELLRAHGYTVTPPDAPYTPPCDAPNGFEWAGEERCPRENEWYWSMAYRRPALASFDFETDKHHIFRKLPPQLKVGDRRWVEVIVCREPDCDGDVKVEFPSGDKDWLPASALHATPGGGE